MQEYRSKDSIKKGVFLKHLAMLSIAFVAIGWAVLVLLFIGSPLSWPLPVFRAIVILCCWGLSTIIGFAVMFQTRSQRQKRKLQMLAIIAILTSLASLALCTVPILGHLKRVQHFDNSSMTSSIEVHGMDSQSLSG